MAMYIVRVELHGATAQHYEILHEAMAANFDRTIEARNGLTYQLPTAMYFYRSPVGTLEQITRVAETAAAKTGLKAWVFAMDVSEARWAGLPLANALTNRAAH